MENPFIINYYLDSKTSKPLVSLLRYVPFADTKEIVFDMKDIMNVLVAKQSMSQYYEHVLQLFEKTIITPFIYILSDLFSYRY